MTILIYLASIVVFTIAAMIAPLLLMPIVWLYKTIAREAVIQPTHPVFLLPSVLATIILLNVTKILWMKWEMDTGWLFPLIIAIVHFILGSAAGANRANQAQAWGVIIGVGIYGLIALF